MPIPFGGVKMKEFVIENSLKPVLKFIINNKNRFLCNTIKDHLEFFRLLNQNKLCDNSSLICFEKLARMYSANPMPKNIFWVCSDSPDLDQRLLNQTTILNELNQMIRFMIDNGFELVHNWSFDFENNIGIFIYLQNNLEKPTEFIAICLALNNDNNLLRAEEVALKLK
ncbi:MAG: hypothetical protein KGP35_05995 [Bacteroidetes bacterium]|nr:hypothetical protein [Bacteroidota bacterium]